VVDAAVGDAPLSDTERQKLVALTIELVGMLAAELTPSFWKPNRQPAQAALGARVFEMLMASRLLPTPQLEALTDKLMELARANHERLMKI
jgi:type I restriction enzyme R subunit